MDGGLEIPMVYEVLTRRNNKKYPGCPDQPPRIPSREMRVAGTAAMSFSYIPIGHFVFFHCGIAGSRGLKLNQFGSGRLMRNT